MHANIWIRKDNEEVWNLIKDKSDFVNALTQTHEFGKVGHENVGKLHDEIVKRHLSKVAEPVQVASDAFAGRKLCKNNHAIPKGREKCLFKGCKYA